MCGGGAQNFVDRSATTIGFFDAFPKGYYKNKQKNVHPNIDKCKNSL